MGIFGKNSKEQTTKSIGKDIGFIEEVFELCKNMISIESHAFGSYVSTGNEEFLELNKKMRKLRTRYLNMITEDKGQSWCISKHLCEVHMRLQEVYTRFLSIDDTENAKTCAKDSGEIYMEFLKLNNHLNKDVESNSSA